MGDLPVRRRPDSERAEERTETFRALLADEPEVARARARVLAADEVLADAVAQAVKALEAAMATIAKRYEQEQPEE